MNTETRPEPDQLARSWDTYWQGTSAIRDWTAGGVNHPAILEFWEDCFRSFKGLNERPAFLDIGCGNGALAECALNLFGDAPLEITCVDISEAAISSIQARFPAVSGLACDARSIPLESGRFDIVTSQFGVEYAGPEAVEEAMRLVAPGGSLVLLMHILAGSIYQESSASLDAISRLRNARFIPLAVDMFRAGFDAVKGAEREPYENAARALQGAVDAVEEIVSEYGEGVAGGSIAQLYSDVARIHSRLPNFDPEEVLEWLTRVDTEMADYADRASSMMKAALDEETFKGIVASLVEKGFAVQQAAPFLAVGQQVPLGWVLVAKAGADEESGNE